MSYSILIKGVQADLPTFERFCLRSGWTFLDRARRGDGELLRFTAGPVEIALRRSLTEAVVFVSVPWRSPGWRRLFAPAAAVRAKFGGVWSGDGLDGSEMNQQEWERHFQQETGEAC